MLEDLTDKERTYIEDTSCCPDCKTGELQGGPCGGMNQNFRCTGCGQEYNLALYGTSVPFAQRLDRSQPELYGGEFMSDALEELKRH